MPKNYDLQEIAEDLKVAQLLEPGEERERLLRKLLPVLFELVNTMTKIAEKIGDPVDDIPSKRLSKGIATRDIN